MPVQLIRFPNLTGAGQPIAERVNIHLLDFTFIFNEALGIAQGSARKPTHLPRLILLGKTHGERGFGDHDNAPAR
jgi:hypothetical protein